jgi:hypothetical protein
MDQGILYLILYLSINFLVTLIWVTIPGGMQIYRRKYNLPPKMVIWPMTSNFIMEISENASGIVIYTIFAPFLIVPIIICYFIYKSISCIFGSISFSKKEKKEIAVQIALGTMEGKKDDE